MYKNIINGDFTKPFKSQWFQKFVDWPPYL